MVRFLEIAEDFSVKLLNNFAMIKNNKQKNKKIEELQQKIDIKLIQNSQLNKEEKMALEKRLSGYLKEIDTCLMLLNKE